MNSKTGETQEITRDAATRTPGEPSRTKWTIGAVSTETKAAVRRAAAKDGLTISEWVDRTLHKAATDTLKGGTPGLALPPDLLVAIDDISRKLDHIDSELQKDPDRLGALSNEFNSRFDDLRTRMNGSFERLQSSANTMVESVVGHTDAAVTQSRRMADRALDRIIETSDAAVDSIRQFRRPDADEKSDGTPTSGNAKAPSPAADK